MEMDPFAWRVSHQLPKNMSVPFQSGQRCFSDILGSQVCICFSSFSTHRKGIMESKSGLLSNVHNNPSMTRPTMVSRASENTCKKSKIY